MQAKLSINVDPKQKMTVGFRGGQRGGLMKVNRKNMYNLCEMW
jgi:hypothetical protein